MRCLRGRGRVSPNYTLALTAGNGFKLSHPPTWRRIDKILGKELTAGIFVGSFIVPRREEPVATPSGRRPNERCSGENTQSTQGGAIGFVFAPFARCRAREQQYESVRQRLPPRHRAGARFIASVSALNAFTTGLFAHDAIGFQAKVGGDESASGASAMQRRLHRANVAPSSQHCGHNKGNGCGRGCTTWHATSSALAAEKNAEPKASPSHRPSCTVVSRTPAADADRGRHMHATSSGRRRENEPSPSDDARVKGAAGDRVLLGTVWW